MIFAITDFAQLGVYASRLVAFGSSCDDFIYYLRNYGVVMLIGCVMSTPLLSGRFEKIRRTPAGYAVLITLLFVSVCYLADASYNPFLYFRF